MPSTQKGGMSSRDKQAMTVRLPADVYLALHQKADEELRTVSAQLEFDLRMLYGRRLAVAR